MPENRQFDEAESIRRIEAGGLPLRAEQRLQDARNAGSSFFSSTLSVPEGLVARATGYDPIAQVMGSSMYNVGFQGSVTGEATVLSLAHLDARSRALSRLYQEAKALGAHAVVGVTLKRRDYEWAMGLAEFTAIGTAIRVRGAPPISSPALSLMNADELWKAQLAGFWPVGIAMGNCCWHVRHADCLTERSVGFWNQELRSHTEAAYEAEGLAVQRFRDSAANMNADGVLGVKLERSAFDREWEANDISHTSFQLELLMLGTAVVRVAKPAALAQKLMVLDLRDRKIDPENRREKLIENSELTELEQLRAKYELAKQSSDG